MMKGLSKMKKLPIKKIFSKNTNKSYPLINATVYCDMKSFMPSNQVNFYVKESWPNEAEMGISWEDLMKTKDCSQAEKERSPLWPTDSGEDQRIESYFTVRGICPVDGCRHNLIIVYNPEWKIQCSRYPRCSHQTDVPKEDVERLQKSIDSEQQRFGHILKGNKPEHEEVYKKWKETGGFKNPSNVIAPTLGSSFSRNSKKN
eukprot:TRINITY_DN579_c0_g1_i1.p1 TRINITY_DN579_c0_g1~~TRINITY_DN579_c0_g1_i1.p1  ORF type:complete len:202 (-),score=48.81 TRINITY_DN579_c0_g1_i1:107-712(-)